MEPSKDIFKCHSSLDKQFLRFLIKLLKEENINAWLDEGELNTGDSLIQRITTAIDKTPYFSKSAPYAHNACKISM
jgi:hypothetical protein